MKHAFNLVSFAFIIFTNQINEKTDVRATKVSTKYKVQSQS